MLRVIYTVCADDGRFVCLLYSYIEGGRLGCIFYYIYMLGEACLLLLSVVEFVIAGRLDRLAEV